MKKRFGVCIVLLVGVVLALSILAARLPTVGGDSNTWGTVMNDFLNVAHESGGNIKSSYITGGMIAETTIERGDLADNLINSSKITDGGVANRNINESAINGTQISPQAAVNVSNLIVRGANTSGALTIGLANITGIFFNRTRIDLPAISNGTCIAVPVNMTGIPSQVSCIPVGNPNLANVAVYGLNSTANNCRIAVCAITVGASVDLPLLDYGAFGLATGLDNTVAGPAG